MRAIKFILIGILALMALAAGAQPDSLRLQYSVSGRVSDARSGKAIQAANIQVLGRNHATVSNADGGFVIRSDSPIRELVFSCLGYKTLQLRVGEGEVKARLAPEKYLLDASSITTGDPEEILRSAILSVPDNYSRRPELLRCFYRETLQKRGRYIAVSEAVARIWKSAYPSPVWADKAALEKSRIIMSQRRRDTLSVRLQGGPTLSITADAVKNQDMFFYDVEHKMYRYEMGNPEYLDGRLQFVIRFFPVTSAPYALCSGTVHVDQETLAFSRIEIHTDMSEPEKVIPQLLVRRPLGLRFTPRELSFVMSYRPTENGHYRMEYFRSTIRFDCDWKKRMFATSYTLVNESVVTDVVQPAAAIPREEQFKTSDALSDKALEFQDPAFWEGYNIIAPSESLEHAVGRLRKNQ
ncbi:MAG: carboxypeptidase-like regulatory domain-containing protein [Bacteroidales bacterium]|nr:carboxypeptidase-like regulatory domain-containing protein [Bacteroidales bacterium]